MLQLPEAVEHIFSFRNRDTADSHNSQIKMRRKKNVKKGIQFCLMVCGASGTGMFIIHLGLSCQESTNHLHSGRTTFVNTLCGKKVLQSKDSDDPTHAHLEEGVKIKPITVGRLQNENQC